MCVVWGTAWAILNFRTVGDQEQVRPAPGDQREAFGPLQSELGHSRLSSSWKNLDQLLIFQGSCSTHELLLHCGRLVVWSLQQSKHASVKSICRPTLWLKWVSWAILTLLGSQAQLDEDSDIFAFQNWASFSFMCWVQGPEVSTEQKMGLGHTHCQNQIEPRLFESELWSKSKLFLNT